MKKLLTLLFITAVSTAKSQLPSAELLSMTTFPGLTNEIKPGYGTTVDNPIPSGVFMHITDRRLSQNLMLRLKNSYRWPNGESLDFSKRFSTGGKSGVVDCYTMVRSGSTDTVRLFVDPYHVATQYFVPAGLAALTRESLAKELIPYIKQAEELLLAADGSLLTATYGQLLGYLGMQFGAAPFLDPDMIKAVANDEAADKELKNYLIRVYATGKFYAYAKDIPNPQQYGFDQMKAAFKKSSALHPEIKSGALSTTLK